MARQLTQVLSATIVAALAANKVATLTGIPAGSVTLMPDSRLRFLGCPTPVGGTCDLEITDVGDITAIAVASASNGYQAATITRSQPGGSEQIVVPIRTTGAGYSTVLEVPDAAVSGRTRGAVRLPLDGVTSLSIGAWA